VGVFVAFADGVKCRDARLVRPSIRCIIYLIHRLVTQKKCVAWAKDARAVRPYKRCVCFVAREAYVDAGEMAKSSQELYIS